MSALHCRINAKREKEAERWNLIFNRKYIFKIVDNNNKKTRLKTELISIYIVFLALLKWTKKTKTSKMMCIRDTGNFFWNGKY